ncbi:MAG: rhomboid family intramembrane serine protease [Bacteroidales bacterium]|jgi:membrane associated rhomboid family serine protease|nr:rhomboid family intramembrane serine protease [Bacteroidales bacterium]
MITWFIIGITTLVSYIAFQNTGLMEKLRFNAAKIIQDKEYYRLVTHAFIHANWSHLTVNMLVLYFFGPVIENYLNYNFGIKANLFYIFLYFGGILISNIQSLIKHRNNYYYNAVGASGAVSAVLFAFIFFDPLQKILVFFVLPIPGILFAVIYLIYSYQMSKRDNDNIAHEAHLLGALFGFIFPVLLKPSLFETFIDKLLTFL